MLGEEAIALLRKRYPPADHIAIAVYDADSIRAALDPDNLLTVEEVNRILEGVEKDMPNEVAYDRAESYLPEDFFDRTDRDKPNGD